MRGTLAGLSSGITSSGLVNLDAPVSAGSESPALEPVETERTELLSAVAKSSPAALEESSFSSGSRVILKRCLGDSVDIASKSGDAARDRTRVAEEAHE